MQWDKLSFPMVAALLASLLIAPSADASRRGSRGPHHGLDPVRARIVEAAYAYLEERRAPGRQDCSGFVTTVLAEAGLSEHGGTPAIYARAEAEGRLKRGGPVPGDVVFFDRTFDRDRDGRVDDPLTHVAIVVDVYQDGTIEMVHRSRRGARPTLLRMNLDRPHKHKRRGVVLNDVLSAPGYGPRRLTGELFRGFASPPRGRAGDRWRADRPRHGGHDGYAGPRHVDRPGHRHPHPHGHKPGRGPHKHGRDCGCDDGRRGEDYGRRYRL